MIFDGNEPMGAGVGTAVGAGSSIGAYLLTRWLASPKTDPYGRN
jgi:hypothetical protein